MTRTSFSNAAFARLVRRLRRTNARYDRIAHQIRRRIRHTYHAKRRAYWTGLRIDTSKARSCPGKYVSTQPLPVLDQSPAYSPAVGACRCCRRGSEGRQCILVRLPPPKNVEYQCCCAAEASSQFQGPVPVPGAPRLTPRQLPEDECGAEVFESSSSAVDAAKSDPSTPPTGLCITTPPRNLKRKLQDVEAEEGAVLSHQTKRFLKTRVDEPRYQ